LFQDYPILRDLLTKQITHLNIDIQNEKILKLSKMSSHIFVLILSLCKRLIKLNFCQLFSYGNLLISIHKQPTTICTSSTLTELKINVEHLSDCVCFLYGNFDSLSKLIINVKILGYKPPFIDSSVS
jgi:hypothetical protein